MCCLLPYTSLKGIHFIISGFSLWSCQVKYPGQRITRFLYSQESWYDDKCIVAFSHDRINFACSITDRFMVENAITELVYLLKFLEYCFLPQSFSTIRKNLQQTLASFAERHFIKHIAQKAKCDILHNFVWNVFSWNGKFIYVSFYLPLCGENSNIPLDRSWLISNHYHENNCDNDNRGYFTEQFQRCSGFHRISGTIHIVPI